MNIVGLQHGFWGTTYVANKLNYECVVNLQQFLKQCTLIWRWRCIMVQVTMVHSTGFSGPAAPLAREGLALRTDSA